MTQPYVVSEEKLQVVSVNKEVPIYVDKVVDCVITQQVPVEIKADKLV